MSTLSGRKNKQKGIPSIAPSVSFFTEKNWEQAEFIRKN